MSQSQSKKRRRPAVAAHDKTASEADPQFLPPLKPHRKLFYISALLVAACLVTLLILYITTAPQLRPRGSAPNAPWPTEMAPSREREPARGTPLSPDTGQPPPRNTVPQSVPR